MNERKQCRLRRAVLLGALPVAMAVAVAGTSAADPGQSGVTPDVQAGVTTPNQAPSGPREPERGLAVIIPDPPPPSVPDRPAPQPALRLRVPGPEVVEPEPDSAFEQAEPAVEEPAPPPGATSLAATDGRALPAR
ncbi:hypothetical protein OHB12_04530 [Nocardia sp. NBC_01730]|uniref:hypothetical protein n=1 Tax=Nocardia sp. NBC_01730 TaxID=2975998 RepID=UPI002E0F8EA4|nr:hypothetical protein OHB12_04530 [Nocardia sp. NBC_01730]